jgi:hypothetical protein
MQLLTASQPEEVHSVEFGAYSGTDHQPGYASGIRTALDKYWRFLAKPGTL